MHMHRFLMNNIKILRGRVPTCMEIVKQTTNKTDKEVHILHFVNGNFGTRGLSTIIFNWGKEMVKNRIIFDFINNKYYDVEQYTETIKENGGVVSQPSMELKGIKGQVDFFIRAKRLIEQHKYTIVHLHSDSAYNMIKYAFIPKLKGVKTIIMHSHSSGIDKNGGSIFNFKFFIRLCLHYLCKPLLPFFGTHFLSCSSNASRWMYPSNKLNSVLLINNGIDIKKYTYNEKVRKKTRRYLGVENNFVLGHVGSFTYQKNHHFLINIFNEVLKIRHNAKLVLVGDGELEDEIKKIVKSLNIEDSVIFMGKVNNVNELMQGFDVFLLPSRFEGLPVVGVEAQASGLKCYFSDTIANESKILDNLEFLSLKDSPRIWAENICKYNFNENRSEASKKAIESNFNIEQVVEKLTRFYMNII